MSRRGEKIYKRKDGRWEARYVKGIGGDGKKKYGSVYAGTYREVKERQQHILAAQIPYGKTNLADFHVSALMECWLAQKRLQVKLSTYRKYEYLTRKYILPQVGNCTLSQLTKAGVKACFDELLKHGGRNGAPLSVKTVNDTLALFSRALTFAREEYSVMTPQITFLHEKKREARVLTLEEQARLTTFLLTDMDITRFGVLLALYTGMRIGELCALQWSDFSDSAVSISKTVQRLCREDGKTVLLTGEPKSESSRRSIPLVPFLLPYLEKFRKKDGYVLYTSHRMRTEPRTMQRKFANFARQCGLQDVTFHTLRHTFATRCVEAGFEIKALSEILGHSDVKITLNRYVHTSFSFKQYNMEKLPIVR